MRKAEDEKVMSCEMPKARYDLPVLKSRRQPKESPVVRKPKARKVLLCEMPKAKKVLSCKIPKARKVLSRIKSKARTEPLRAGKPKAL